MLQKLPIAFPQVKADYTFENRSDKKFLYCVKWSPKKIYNIIINLQWIH